MSEDRKHVFTYAVWYCNARLLNANTIKRCCQYTADLRIRTTDFCQSPNRWTVGLNGLWAW